MGIFDWLSERRSGYSAASKALIRAVGASYDEKLTPTSAEVEPDNPSGLRMIDAYPIAHPVPHWLYVTDGLSADHSAEAGEAHPAAADGDDTVDAGRNDHPAGFGGDDPAPPNGVRSSETGDYDPPAPGGDQTSGHADDPLSDAGGGLSVAGGAGPSQSLGIEFTMRVVDERATLPSRTPPEWPMQKLLQLVLEEAGRPDTLTEGSTVMFPTSAQVPLQPPELSNVLVLADPVLGLQEVDAIGPVQFLQVVLISDDDYRDVRESGLEPVVARLRAQSPLAPIIVN